MTLTDLSVEDHGSVVLFVPRTTRGDAWLREHTQAEAWQWVGTALACEPRYVEAVVAGACEDGLVVEAHTGIHRYTEEV